MVVAMAGVVLQRHEARGDLKELHEAVGPARKRTFSTRCPLGLPADAGRGCLPNTAASWSAV